MCDNPVVDENSSNDLAQQTWKLRWYVQGELVWWNLITIIIIIVIIIIIILNIKTTIHYS